MNTKTFLLVTSGAIAGGYVNYLFNETYYNLFYGYYPYDYSKSILNYGFIFGSSLGFATSFVLDQIKIE